MKTLSLRMSLLVSICLIAFATNGFAQQGTVTLNQDKNIDKLLDLKKEMNKTDNLTDRYKIQVYSGNRGEAEATQTKFNAAYENWKSNIVYEYPNFKIWAGSFTTRLEADRALKEVKRKFPSAFIFKPKK
ncbi:SPOR domain-containing protein [Gaetbulibacter aquiaggeris]|uniref:SPOR domain-containing protein n=1 Tax=Gaetbulibacter aquiaggeris TaxID=1735373 RepID=A0ABW7MNV7_9FLAO